MLIWKNLQYSSLLIIFRNQTLRCQKYQNIIH